MTELLLAEQAIWDTLQFDPESGYSELAEREQKARHILLHSVKAAGKLAIAEAQVLTTEVIPDLFIYRSQLINIFSLPHGFFHSYRPSEKLTHSPIESARKALGIANFSLATYLELREHGLQSDEVHVEEAAKGFHMCAVVLADHYEVDGTSVHMLRMKQLLGKGFPQPFVE